MESHKCIDCKYYRIYNNEEISEMGDCVRNKDDIGHLIYFDDCCDYWQAIEDGGK